MSVPVNQRAEKFKVVAAAKQLGEGFGVCVTNGLSETCAFAQLLNDEEASFLQDNSASGSASTGNTSAGGRCGWFSSPLSLFRQPDFAHYAKAYGHHTMVMLHPSNVERLLLLYPAGPNCKKDQALPQKLQRYDGPGQPRVHAIYPGRTGLSIGNPSNVSLQRKRGPSFSHNVRKAQAGLLSLLLLDALGLGEGGGLLHNAVGDTIRYTRELFSWHQTLESAMSALACLKGFYVNRWPAAFHTDADKYMETWSIRQDSPAPCPPVATIVPQLRLALTADPNASVWTATLSDLMHAAADFGGSAIWAAARGANDAFHLQARGARNIPRWT